MSEISASIKGFESLNFKDPSISANFKNIVSKLADPLKAGGWKTVATDAFKFGGIAFLVGLLKGVVIELLVPPHWRETVDTIFKVVGCTVGIGCVAIA